MRLEVEEIVHRPPGVVFHFIARECKVVEFKSTGRKNLHTGDKDAADEFMEKGVVLASIPTTPAVHNGLAALIIARPRSKLILEASTVAVSRSGQCGPSSPRGR